MFQEQLNSEPIARKLSEFSETTLGELYGIYDFFLTVHDANDALPFGCQIKILLKYNYEIRKCWEVLNPSGLIYKVITQILPITGYIITPIQESFYSFCSLKETPVIGDRNAFNSLHLEAICRFKVQKK